MGAGPGPTAADRDVTPPGTATVSRLGLAALLGVAAAGHVFVPRAYESMVPVVLPGPAAAWNLAAAAAEGVTALLLVDRRTARLGGWLATATFVAVFPANVEAALQGGYGAAPPPFDTTAAAWLRLPLQVPLVWWAVLVARERDGRDHRGPGGGSAPGRTEQA